MLDTLSFMRILHLFIATVLNYKRFAPQKYKNLNNWHISTFANLHIEIFSYLCTLKK
jgi:hypothetical protein